MNMRDEVLERVVKCCQYKDVTFRYGEMGSGSYVQVERKVTDIDTRVETTQRGRKYYISCWATRTEVVTTLLLACKQFEEYGVNENFKYVGRHVFHSHKKVEDLFNFLPKMDVDKRDETFYGKL